MTIQLKGRSESLEQSVALAKAALGNLVYLESMLENPAMARMRLQDLQIQSAYGDTIIALEHVRRVVETLVAKSLENTNTSSLDEK